MSTGWATFFSPCYMDCFVFCAFLCRQAVGFALTMSRERHEKQVLHLMPSSGQLCYIANCIVVIRTANWWFSSTCSTYILFHLNFCLIRAVRSWQTKCFLVSIQTCFWKSSACPYLCKSHERYPI